MQRRVVGYKLQIGDALQRRPVFVAIGSTCRFAGFEGGRDLTVRAVQTPGGLPSCVLDCDRQSNVTAYGTASLQFRPRELGGRSVVASVAPLYEGDPRPSPPGPEPPPPHPPPLIAHVGYGDGEAEEDQEEEEEVRVLEERNRTEKKKRRRASKTRKAPYPEAWPDEPVEAADDQRRCVLCMERATAAYFRECKHAALCIACARGHYEELDGRCPVCRKRFTRILAVPRDIIYV